VRIEEAIVGEGDAGAAAFFLLNENNFLTNVATVGQLAKLEKDCCCLEALGVGPRGHEGLENLQRNRKKERVLGEQSKKNMNKTRSPSWRLTGQTSRETSLRGCAGGTLCQWLSGRTPLSFQKGQKFFLKVQGQQH